MGIIRRKKSKNVNSYEYGYGMNMYSGEDGSFLLNDNTPFLVSEGYKSLRTNIMFSLPDEGCKCIAITSGAVGDRKTSTIINLALSFAELGKKVILIDCDLRLPTVAKKLGVRSLPGLSDLIIGNAVPGEVISKVRENLYVLPAGSIPKDATGLLASNRLKMLISKLKGIYDYILIDLPPVTTVTDAAILTESIDGFLLAVQHERSEYKEVSAMIKSLKMANAKILGFVYTAAPTAQKKQYAYYK